MMNRTEGGLFQHKANGPHELNIRELITKYMRYWYLFTIGVMICLLAAFLHIRYNFTPEYYVSSTLLIKENSSTGVVPVGLSGGMGDYGVNKNLGSEIIVLRSNSLMERVFVELSLYTSFFIEGRFKDMEVYKEDLPISLFISELKPSAYGKIIKLSFMDNNTFGLTEYDGQENSETNPYKFGQEIKRNYASFTVIGTSENQFSKDIIIKFHNIKQSANIYSQKLGVAPVSNDANVVRLSLTDPIPQRSVEILDKLVEVYNQEAVEDKNEVELSTIEFLDERINFLSMELSDVEKNVEVYKQQNNLTDVSSNAEMYVSAANEYNKELENYELQLDIISSLEKYLNQKELQLVPSALNIPDPTLNGLIAKFNELQLERQRMLRSIQPTSSLILNLDNQLLNLKQNISENLKNIKNGLTITLNNLQSSSSQFQSKIRNVPSIERELLEINRQQSIKQAIYLFLLQSREEAGLKLASNTANSRIVDTAAAGDSPINSNHTTIYLAAFSLGLLIPFGFIYLKDLLNDKIVDKKGVEKMTNIPILGEIFHSEIQDTLQIVEGNHSTIAETFRLVRSNLNFANLGKENKVILVTSSRSGEGKTFFSINFGASLAISGKKVLILGFDLRKPNLIKNLGLEEELGVTDYLISDKLELAALLLPVKEVKGLYVLGSGTIPPNPAELMMSPKVGSLIDELKQLFDYIIVDSSPIGQVADSFNLVPYIDTTLYIIRYNYTYKAHLPNIEDIYQNKKLGLAWAVLNDAKKENVPAYGYGYGYSQEMVNGKRPKKSKVTS